VTRLLEDSRGSIWVGTDGGGLNRFDPETGSFSRFTHDPEDPGSLASDSVFALHIDAAGTLWIGTRGGGLDRLGHAAQAADHPTFKNYSQRDGLPNEVIYGILPDGDGTLWLSTNNGLSRLDTRAETFVNYDANDGLQSNEFHFGSAYRSPQGELFFGGVNGFNAFYPARLQNNPHAPPVVLTSFLKFNQPVPDLGPSAEIRAIDLGYDDDVVTFEFAALDYSSPDDNRYVYMLEGFDKDWVDSGDVRRVTYTNLDPGQYVFRVRGTNNDGVWSEQGLSLALDVETPPWQTAWAYALYALILGGVVLAFLRAQERKLKREAAYSRRLEQEVDTRTAELAQRNEELVQASITDSLTGLANRRYLLEYMAKEVSQIQRRYARLVDGETHDGSFDLAFMMVDLDNFKTINDTCGHAAGDVVLRQLKTILEDACRNSDILIRWGGDELLVVARDTDQSGVEALAERIRSRIEGHGFELEDGQVVRTTSSIGFACYPFLHSPHEVLSWEQVVSTADRALYVAKRSGRNAWVGFLGADKAPAKNLMEDLLYNPRQLALDGLIEVRTSIAGEIIWDCHEPHQLPVRVEPGIPDPEAPRPR
jgi:diguanylate cyclase (GGDEF)-like protein